MMSKNKRTIPLERVKELEAMVEKLTLENEQLLTQVKTDEYDSSCTYTINERDPAMERAMEEKKNLRDSDEDILPLNDVGAQEDEWLFVSPVKPPTEEQRKLTPSQWLEEGHHEAEVPTLEEVRKSLAYSMNEAEQLTRRAASNRHYSATPKNKTAQKYLQSVRQRRGSQSDSDDERISPIATSMSMTTPIPTTMGINSRMLHNVQRPIVGGRGRRMLHMQPSSDLRIMPQATDSEGEIPIDTPPKGSDSEGEAAPLTVQWNSKIRSRPDETIVLARHDEAMTSNETVVSRPDATITIASSVVSQEDKTISSKPDETIVKAKWDRTKGERDGAANEDSSLNIKWDPSKMATSDSEDEELPAPFTLPHTINKWELNEDNGEDVTMETEEAPKVNWSPPKPRVGGPRITSNRSLQMPGNEQNRRGTFTKVSEAEANGVATDERRKTFTKDVISQSGIGRASTFTKKARPQISKRVETSPSSEEDRYSPASIDDEDTSNKATSSNKITSPRGQLTPRNSGSPRALSPHTSTAPVSQLKRPGMGPRVASPQSKLASPMPRGRISSPSGRNPSPLLQERRGTDVTNSRSPSPTVTPTATKSLQPPSSRIQQPRPVGTTPTNIKGSKISQPSNLRAKTNSYRGRKPSPGNIRGSDDNWLEDCY